MLAININEASDIDRNIGVAQIKPLIDQAPKNTISSSAVKTLK